MNWRSRKARSLGAGSPGFALPTRYLILGGVFWTICFLAGVFLFATSVVLERGGMAWDDLVLAPFVLGACTGLWLAVQGQDLESLRTAIFGVRITCITVLLAGACLGAVSLFDGIAANDAGTMLWSLLFAGSIFALVVAPVLFPLWGIERRLSARHAAGNPRWHPHQASMSQRSEAVLAVSATVSGFTGALIGLWHGLSTMPGFDADNFRMALVAAPVGFMYGAMLGCLPAGLLSYALNDRDLSRSLPPIMIWTPLAGLAGAIAGVGWGILAAIATMLVLGKLAVIRYKLFDPGCCQACGYNLEGLRPHDDRCPECGTAITPVGVAAGQRPS